MKLLVDEILFWAAVVLAELNVGTALLCLLALSWWALLFAGCAAFWAVFAWSCLDDIRAGVDR